MGNFLVTHRFDGVGNGSTVAVLVRVNAAKELVFGVDLECSGIWDVTFYEGPTLNAPGTALQAVDTDRAAAGSPDSLFYHTPNVAIDGTLIGDLTAGDKAVSKVGERESGPFVLAAGTDYVLYAINRSGAAMDIGFRIKCTENPSR